MYRTKLHRKADAGALYYVIFVCFILSAIALFFLVLRSLKCKSIREELDYYQKIDNINSALTIYLSNSEQYQKLATISVLTLDDSSSIVEISRSSWGIYDKISAKTYYRGKELSRSILTGKDPFNSDSIALWVPNQNQAIYASGNSQIIGNVRIPSKGIQRASIEGKPLQVEKVISGKSKFSERDLPALSDRIIEKLKSLQNFDSLSNIGPSILSASVELLENDFSESTIWLSSSQDLQLSNFQCHGNIGIITGGTIHLRSDSELDRIILSCSKIVVEDGFKGSVQIFAKDSIIIGSNCKFEYPSIICLYNENVNKIYVEIGSSSIITGSLIVFQENLAVQKPYLKINDGAIILGQVYHKGTIELYGDIYGSLFCEDFYLKTSRAFYKNHLLDNIIDFTKLPIDIVLPDLEQGYSDQVIDFLNEDF